MPIALLLIGAAILISAIRNTHKQLGQQLVTDFSGSGSFLVWIAAIAVVGMLGYISKFETPSRALLGLILLAMFLANGGVFAQLQSAVQSPGTAPAAPKEPTIDGPAPIKLIGAGGSGGLLNSIIGAGIKSLSSGGATTAATGGL